MSTKYKYYGMWPVAPTPFRDNGEVDYEGMERVLDCMVDQKVQGICILANYSEQFLLSDDEREKLTKLCMKKIDGRVKTIITVSHFATDIVRPRAELAKSLGADIIMMMPPYHGALLKGNADQIFEQFDEISSTIKYSKILDTKINTNATVLDEKKIELIWVRIIIKNNRRIYKVI